MPKEPDQLTSDEVPKRLLNAPPKPFTPRAKAKPNPGGPATKAEHRALKQVDKMVIKRMRKR